MYIHVCMYMYVHVCMCMQASEFRKNEAKKWAGENEQVNGIPALMDR
jgi:hypothetical protein